MVEITPEFASGRIEKIIFSKDDFKKNIDFKSLELTRTSDSKNIGMILEKYRKELSQAYFDDNLEILTNTIEKSRIQFDGFIPDHLMCFLPEDKNRKIILEKFRNKLMDKVLDWKKIDFSSSFSKKDASKSIKDGLNKDDFTLSDNLQPIKSLLIIDDIIDEGRTLDIYLEKLFDEKLIDENTTIKLACIYTNPKSKNISSALKNWKPE